MGLQKWPDGGDEWTLFIWGRHPKWSATWTHSLTVSLERKGAWDGPRSWGRFRVTRQSSGIGFYFRIGRLHGGLQRQSPIARKGGDA